MSSTLLILLNICCVHFLFNKIIIRTKYSYIIVRRYISIENGFRIRRRNVVNKLEMINQLSDFFIGSLTWKKFAVNESVQ